MLYNVLIGGAAGQGVETTAGILEKLLKRAGYCVFTMRDFMSRIRGGHNFSVIRFGDQPVASHSGRLDGIVALNDETVRLHIADLKEDGFILCDSRINTDDRRVLRLPLEETAKTLGNPRVSGGVAIGALLKLFGIGRDEIGGVLSEFVKEGLVEINRKAAEEGAALVETKKQAPEGGFADHLILSGSSAMALGAVAAGLRFYSAYPMSPATPVMEYLASKADEAGIVVEQAEDEIAAANMAIGASYAGAPAMTGTSGGGFCLMVEALGLSGIAEIPLVVADVQRPGPATGLPTRTEQSDLSFVLTASQGEFPRAVIAVRHHADAFYQTARAFYLAEKYQLPVILLSDQYLGDASATIPALSPEKIVRLSPAREYAGEGPYLRYRYTESGVSPRLVPGKTEWLVTADSDEHDEKGFITESAEVRTRMTDKRMKKLEGLRAEMLEPDFFGPEEFDTLLLAWGSLHGPVAEAVGLVNRAGGRVAALVFGDLYPLPTGRLLEKAAKAKKIVNVEQNATGQLAHLIRGETGVTCDASILKYDGRQLSGEEIAEKLALL